MRKIFLSFTLLLLWAINSQVSFAQAEYLNFDKEAFLIGTLSDYLGHEQVFEEESNTIYFERMDLYAQQERKIANLILFLFKDEHPDLKLNNIGTTRKFGLYSSTLSKLVNTYYNYEPSDNQTEEDNIIYIGSLKIENFKTEKQKLSFLAGAYLRYGSLKHNDTVDPQRHMYDIPNSLSKANACETFLRDLGCKDVEEVTNEYMPTKKEILFTPSDEIEKMIETIKSALQKISTAK